MKEIFLTREQGLSDAEIDSAVESLLSQYSSLRKVLVLPPDYTRCYAYAGEITRMLYRRLTAMGCRVDVMPALGTHMPMNDFEKKAFFAFVKACFNNARILVLSMWLAIIASK